MNEVFNERQCEHFTVPSNPAGVMYLHRHGHTLMLLHTHGSGFLRGFFFLNFSVYRCTMKAVLKPYCTWEQPTGASSVLWGETEFHS